MEGAYITSVTPHRPALNSIAAREAGRGSLWLSCRVTSESIDGSNTKRKRGGRLFSPCQCLRKLKADLGFHQIDTVLCTNEKAKGQRV